MGVKSGKELGSEAGKAVESECLQDLGSGP
jgi:hypothetical protein